MAFTLAEVLITLGIIGVVAAMTIPAMINKTNEAEFKTAWKKGFAEVVNATNMYQEQYGDIDFSTNDSIRDAYSKVMVLTEKDTLANLFAPSYFFYKGTSTWDASTDTNSTVAGVTSSGLVIRFFNEANTDCSSAIGNLTSICGSFTIDVNGKKKPNMFGKDLFFLWIVKKNDKYVVYPGGVSYDNLTCEVGSSNWLNSVGCSAMVLNNLDLP